MTHHLVEANYLLTSPKVNLFVIKNVFIDFLRLLIIHVNIKLRSRTYCYFANLRPISIGFVFTLSEVIYNMTRTKQIWTGMPWNLESLDVDHASIQNWGHSCLNMLPGKIYNIHTLYIAEHIFWTRFKENASIVQIYTKPPSILSWERCWWPLLYHLYYYYVSITL